MNDYTDIINSSALVMVEFYATWCPHCRRMEPVVEQIRELLAGSVDIYQLDVDENNEIASEVGVTGTPTFMIYRGGSPYGSTAASSTEMYFCRNSSHS